LRRYTSVTLLPVRFPFVKQGEDLNELVDRTLRRRNLSLRNGDVLAVASKIVSCCENRILRLDTIRVSAKAVRLSEQWKMDTHLASIVVQEADYILGGILVFLLTIKDAILTANAGVDLKNSPRGTATLWPRNSDKSASRLRKHLTRKGVTCLGVEIVDSRVTPLRLGTIGLAIGSSGFEPVHDYRSKPDLYGREVRVTQTNIADDLASAAHMLMGEAREQIGAVVIRNSPVIFGSSVNSSRAILESRRCLISSNF